MTTKVTLTGDKVLDAVFKAFGPKLQRKVAKKALRKVAKPVLADVKADAPVDKGDYQRAIKLRALSARAAKKEYGEGVVGVRVTCDVRELEKLHDETGNVFNPHWMEYGTIFIAAQPHFRPALDAHQGSIEDRFHNEIKPLIEETAQELRRN